MDFPFTAPLLHRDGYQIAEIEGVADIQIDDNGDWYVAGIQIEERKRNGKTLHCRLVTISNGHHRLDSWGELYTGIWRHVENDCAEEIETAMYEASLLDGSDRNDEHRTYRAEAL